MLRILVAVFLFQVAVEATYKPCIQTCEDDNVKVNQDNDKALLRKTVNSLAECCELCRNTTDCAGYDWKENDDKKCRLFKAGDLDGSNDCKYNQNNYKFGTLTNSTGGECCPADVSGDAGSDPHFHTLDGKMHSVYFLPNEYGGSPASYVLFRTVACRQDTGKSDVPPMNFEFGVSDAFSAVHTSRLTHLSLEFHFEQIFEDGNYFKILLDTDGKLVQEKVLENGAGEDQSHTFCSVKTITDSPCPEGKPTVVVTYTEAETTVEVTKVGLKLTYAADKFLFKMTISHDGEAIDVLKSNVMGFMGNYDGNPDNDVACPGANDEAENSVFHERLARCMMVHDTQNAAVIDSNSASHFYQCPAKKE